MAAEVTYNGAVNYKGAEDYLIENGIISGIEVPYITKHSSYGELVLEHLKARPNYVGQVDAVTDREETFAEMTVKSVKCAMWLKAQNIEIGDVIGICTHNQMDMYVPCFASLFVGAVFNPWCDVGLTKEVARHFITVTKPKFLFVNEASATIALEVAKEMEISIKVVVFGKQADLQSLDDILDAQDVKLVPEYQCTKLSSLDDPAYIVYTSGSTGLPKGVLLSHRSLFGYLPPGPLDSSNPWIFTSMIFSSLSWLTGIHCLLRGVVVPDRRIIYPEMKEEKTLELIEKYKVYYMVLGPSEIFRLQKSLAISKYDLTSLKGILVVGATLNGETQKALAESFPHTRIVQAYGSAELGGVGIQQAQRFKRGSCGKVFKNVAMKVIDPQTGKILGPNQTGEACFKSPFIMSRYYNNPEATSEVLDSEGWLHTSDLVHYDEEGYIFVTDRMREMIKYRRYQVSPAMIEQVLQTHQGVSEVAVFGIPHDIYDQHPIAFVAKTSNTDVTKEELQKLVADTLPDYMRLRGGVKFLDELPHTSSGKVDRAALRNLAKSYACGK